MQSVSHTDLRWRPSRLQLSRHIWHVPPEPPIRMPSGSVLTPRITGAARCGNLLLAAGAVASARGRLLRFRLRFIDQALRVQLRTVPTVTGMMSLTSTVKR